MVLAWARPGGAQPLPLLDVPFISQSEALCGGAAAAMVLRYWGAQGLDAESFAPLVDRSAAGIRTDVLVTDLVRRGYTASGITGDGDAIAGELARGRPVIALVEDRPGTYHYVVVVGWHERGVVFHDPARASFQVAPRQDFERRWAAAQRWMLVLTPPSPAASSPPSPAVTAEASACQQQIAEGVRAAQANQLDTAERLLTAAVACQGGAAYRELAGVRLLQRRWDEVRALSAAALADDPGDAQAWRLLGTARFVQDDVVGALDAWNHAGEPTLDLVRIDGLVRTRQRPVEEFLGLRLGTLFTADAFRRAQRAAAELPAAAAAGVTYVPTGQGRVEARVSLVERSALPRGALPFIVFGARTAVARELELGVASFAGSGDRLSGRWRFWPERPRYAVTFATPGAGRGIWQVDAVAERQPFSDDRQPSERVFGELAFARWETANLRWSAGGGFFRWKVFGRYASASGSARLVSTDNRATLQAAVQAWAGTRRFTSWQLAGGVRTSTNQTGGVALVRAAASGVTSRTLGALWPAGDTGHARATLLRAHPLLDRGRLRVERLGRRLVTASIEGQWWVRQGPVSLAPAAFVDLGWTGQRMQGGALRDADVGAGLRLAALGIGGTLRIDVARGLRDGASALSLVYEP